ncbi:fumarylacetoacetate hydrolase family protein [Microbacterium lacticum]
MRRDGEALRAIEDPYAAHAAGRLPADLETAGEVTGDVLAPSEPQVVVGIAQNGPDHPSPVQAWLKSPRTVVASGTAVTLRRDAGTPVAEGEIAVVIARGTAGLTVQNAGDYVLGLSAVDDLSSPDRVLADPRNFESKSGVGHTPLEPWIDTEASLADVRLRMRVDGRDVADTSADLLPVSIAECLAYVASWSTLGPGDVVMTGAPYSQSPVRPGQTIEIEVGAVRLVTTTR